MNERNENNVDVEYWVGVHERGEEQFGEAGWGRIFTLGSLWDDSLKEGKIESFYKEEKRMERNKKRVSRVEQ